MARKSARSRSAAKHRRSRHLLAKAPPLTLVLACEGETEKRYFRELFKLVPELRDHVHVRLARPKGTDLAALVRAADQEVKRIGSIRGLSAWVVCDVDQNQADDLERAKNWCSKDGTRGVALTNPCIEQWFLTYLEARPKSYTKCGDYREEVEAQLPGYSKRRSVQLPAELLDWPATLVAVQRGWRRLNEIHVGEDCAPGEALKAVWDSTNRSTLPLLFSHVARAVNRRTGTETINLSPAG